MLNKFDQLRLMKEIVQPWQKNFKLRMKHGLSLNDVADICGIDVVYVARMELGVPVKLYYARRLRRRLAAYLDVKLTEAVLPVVLIGDEGGSNIQIG